MKKIIKKEVVTMCYQTPFNLIKHRIKYLCHLYDERTYCEYVSMYLSGLSANNSSCRWWASDIKWHLNPFYKQ